MANNIKITWLGHSTVLIQTPADRQWIIDPWLTSNPNCPEENKKLKQLDGMLLTHGHFDHTADAVDLAKEHSPQNVVAIYELSNWLDTHGVQNTVSMNIGGTVQVEDLKVTMVRADHSSAMVDEGTIIYTGDAAGFVIEFETGLKLYHAGDTALFSDMQLIRDLYQPDIAMLPIGNCFTMGPLEAAHACRFINPKITVPLHYGTFPALTGTPEEYGEQLNKVCKGEVTLKTLETGKPWLIEGGKL